MRAPLHVAKAGLLLAVLCGGSIIGCSSEESSVGPTGSGGKGGSTIDSSAGGQAGTGVSGTAGSGGTIAAGAGGQGGAGQAGVGGVAGCGTYAKENEAPNGCNNGVDDDCDGLTDCAVDPDCDNEAGPPTGWGADSTCRTIPPTCDPDKSCGPIIFNGGQHLFCRKMDGVSGWVPAADPADYNKCTTECKFGCCADINLWCKAGTWTPGLPTDSQCPNFDPNWACKGTGGAAGAAGAGGAAGTSGAAGTGGTAGGSGAGGCSYANEKAAPNGCNNATDDDCDGTTDCGGDPDCDGEAGPATGWGAGSACYVTPPACDPAASCGITVYSQGKHLFCRKMDGVVGWFEPLDSTDPGKCGANECTFGCCENNAMWCHNGAWTIGVPTNTQCSNMNNAWLCQ